LLGRNFACVLAHESRDCGPAALATVARHYGLDVRLGRVRDLAGTDMQGSDLAGLCSAAHKLGFRSSCGRAKPGVLNRIPLPAIAHLDGTPTGHFVVVHKVSKQHVIVADPSRGVAKVPIGEFVHRWTRYVVLLEPSSDFRSEGDPENSFKRFLAIVLSEREALFLAVVLAFAVTLLAFGTSFLLQVTLDRVIPHSDLRLLYLAGVGVALVIVFKALATVARQYVLARLGKRLELSIGLDFVRHVLSLPIGFFDKRSPGDILSRLSDVTYVRTAVAGSLLSVFLDASFLVCCAAFLLWYSAKLALIVLFLLPLLVLPTLLAGPALLSNERETRACLSQLTSRFVETVENMRIIKVFSAEEIAYDKVADAYTRGQQAIFRRTVLLGSTGAAFALLSGAASVILLVVGTRFAVVGRLSVGELMFFYSVFGLLLGPAEHLTPSLAAVQDGLVGIERLDDVNLVKPEIECQGHSGWMPERGEIELNNVSFWYREGHPTLSHVDLTIAGGDTLAILGETGAGKTTLGCLIAGLYLPKDGRVLIDGLPTSTIDRKSFRRHVAMVFQEGGLMSGTIRENICLGLPEASPDQIEEAARLAQVHEFILSLPKGYDYNVGVQGGTLSSGQRQRIAIARALIRRAPILVLDEATSHLDIETENRLMEAVLKSRRGATTIIITHRLNTAIRASRIAVMRDGHIVEAGAHAKLIARRGVYYSMWRAFMSENSGAPEYLLWQR
jgi:ATP-binding cassette, subfamily C, bacteriocin exporter